MALSKIKSTGITDSSVTSASIADGAIVNTDINACAAIATSKVASGLVTTTQLGIVDQNISLLGFKMAVNEGLTVFNLVDGVVDEFHDESGNDESESSNDTYCASNDNYINRSADVPYSAGFAISAITEPDTSAAGTNPAHGEGTFGTFTVPTSMTSVDIQAWGAGGGGGPGGANAPGGGGGYAEGTLTVTSEQVLHVMPGEGGNAGGSQASERSFLNGGYMGQPSGGCAHGAGAGLAGVFTTAYSAPVYPTGPSGLPSEGPRAYIIAGSGGGGARSSDPGRGGGGGGLTGSRAGSPSYCGCTNMRSNPGGSVHGGGGDQEQGGQGGSPGSYGSGATGELYVGGHGSPEAGGGGAGRYGGGGGSSSGPQAATNDGAGGGGSSYYGHPQITSGSTETASGCNMLESGGDTQPGYVPGTGEGGPAPTQAGENGYMLLTGTATGSTTTTNIISNAFTAGSAPSTARIVLFEENVATPTLNTDIIASISRDGGTTFTTATLADSGYITGTSGQRILTGTATVSGQPSGTAMRWKLALANNAVKIHGVSLQWK